LFSGTLRFNLDPSGIVADEDIKNLLIEAGLEHLLKRGSYQTNEAVGNQQKS
jgi:ABC-type transport system involved in cytochrome bd biosynthesis fused ATPase/permease subunit